MAEESECQLHQELGLLQEHENIILALYFNLASLVNVNCLLVVFH